MECSNCGAYIRPYSGRCGSCGKIVPPGQHMLEDSGILEPTVPMTAGHGSASGGQRPASLGDRLIAAILDAIVLSGAFAIIGAWSFRRWGFVSGANLHLTSASLIVAGTLSATILFSYLWLLEAAFGATLGKTIVGIRVIRTTYRNALAISAIRNALRIVDGIGFYLVGAMIAGCTRLRQRLGDIVAGTVVVEEQFAFGSKILALVLWTAALAGAGWALPRVCGGEISTHRPPYLGRTVVQLGYNADSAYLRISGTRVIVQRAPASPPNPPPNALATTDSSLR